MDGESGYIALVALPAIACELLTLSGPGLIKHVEATKNDDRFIRIWPPRVERIVWPPGGHLSLYGVNRLYQEWGHAPDMLSGGFPRVTLPNPNAPG